MERGVAKRLQLLLENCDVDLVISQSGDRVTAVTVSVHEPEAYTIDHTMIPR
jgi:hypothetical protein